MVKNFAADGIHNALSDKDAAELAKSGVATQIVPNTNVIVKEDITTICTLAFANTLL